MNTKVYRSVSNWPRDIIFKVEKLQNLLLEIITFVAEKQNFNLGKFSKSTIEISVKFVADHEIKKFNGKYRQQDKPTNVLSFPMLNLNKKLENLTPNVTKKQIYIGDIVFAYQTIRDETIEQNKTMEDHITHLFVHSVLHLLGFDHIKKNDQIEMEALEVELLEKLSVFNIY